MSAADRPPRRPTAQEPERRPRESFSAKAWLRGAFLENLGIKFISFVLSLTVFILVHSDEDQVVGSYVRAAYTMPDDRVVVSDLIDQVRVTVKGSWRRIKRFDEDSIEPIRIDLRRYKSGELTFRPDMVRVPPGLQVVSISPSAIPLQFQPLERKQVPIEPVTVGTPGRGYSVARISARLVDCDPSQEDCSTVTVEGAQEFVAATQSAPTNEISLTGRTESFSTIIGLARPRRFVDVVGDPRVRVDVALAEKVASRELGTVEVRVRPRSGASSLDPSQFEVEPSAVHVVLLGSKLAIDKVEPSEVKAFVNVYADDAGLGRERQAPVVVEGVPRGVAIETNPREVTLRTKPK